MAEVINFKDIAGDTTPYSSDLEGNLVVLRLMASRILILCGIQNFVPDEVYDLDELAEIQTGLQGMYEVLPEGDVTWAVERLHNYIDVMGDSRRDVLQLSGHCHVLDIACEDALRVNAVRQVKNNATVS